MNTTNLTTIKYSLIKYGILTTIITIIFGILMYLLLNVLSKREHLILLKNIWLWKEKIILK